MIGNFEEPTGQQTEYLLRAIAERLSGREDCRKVCYRVTIDHNGVLMTPHVEVFPNRYHRQESDKVDVVSYVHHYKMPNAILPDFVFGTYEYQLSVDGKRRKWRKVDEGI